MSYGIATLEENLKVVPLANYKRIGQKMITRLKQPVLVSLNLKNFRYFNERYGLECGDELISYMAQLFVGDEIFSHLAAFTHIDHLSVLLDIEGLNWDEIHRHIMEQKVRFVDWVNREYSDAKIHLECGMYLVQDKEESFLQMMENASLARRSVHGSYTHAMAVYNENMRENAGNQAEVLTIFECALEENRVELFFQPKISADSHQFTGAEVLSRIRMLDGTLVQPSEYIPILEETGMIVQLDRYVISNLIKQMKLWQEQGKALYTISVNLSHRDFVEPGFIYEIDRMISESGLSKEYFEFELTETVFCEGLDHISNQVCWLREQGYRISMDDFGSGYNSLDIIGTVPIDVVKFDRGFVLRSLKSQKGLQVMDGLVRMFKSIEFDVVCEGVETKEDEEILKGCGCDVIQGFLYDRPIPSNLFERKYLRKEVAYA